MPKAIRKEDALEYHSKGRPGKIEVIPTKDTKTQRDLSLAYSPGVAIPCMEIKDNPDDAYQYTAKGNLVGVITNGTAVLGLGNIGAIAGKPVMEGKGLLFKIFADIDVFDIELNETDPEKLVDIITSLEPTFGGINLEDIKAPECFYVEQELKKRLQIPVMHDDQHGTAIISSAALLNALELQKKDIKTARFVINGAGAAAMACANLYVSLGADPLNFTMFDINGVLHRNRTDMNESMKMFANTEDADIKLSDAMKDADIFVGLSVGNVLNGEMIKSMAKNPIVFAMANPDPEISFEEATASRDDLIMATGRTDYPNQVNNVLGFPYIFRGALDVRATQINEAMKLAAVKALAQLAKSPIPDIVMIAYNEKNLSFGPHYIIPKPMDNRLLTTVSPAVAKAAMDSGVARHNITDWEGYKTFLNQRLGIDNQLLRMAGAKARKDPKRIVFADSENQKILKAAQMAMEEGVAYPILLGDSKKINSLAKANGIDLQGMPIIEPKADEMADKRKLFGELFFKKRQRKGFNHYEAIRIMKDKNYFGCMMVETGEADAMISGLSKNYPDTVRPALQTIGLEPDVKKVAGMYVVFTRKGPLFLADTTVNFNPTSEELADIALLVAREVRALGITPVIAMLSYGNFGSSDSPEARLVSKSVELVKERDPDLLVDGEMQANVAFNKDILKDNYPFSTIVDHDVNILIFPNLAAGNVVYNLLQELAGFEVVGPILIGLNKPVHVLQLGSHVRSIYNMIVISVVDAQNKEKLAESENSGQAKWI